MTPNLILSLSGGWYIRQPDGWHSSPARPQLLASSVILTDFDSAPAGVMAVDNKPMFAAAVIEKRLRAEGLVDGEARVLPHRVLPVGGGCRVLYTAVPVSAWQLMFGWLDNEPSIGLVYTLDDAMLALATRHDAVLCRVGRQFRLLVSQPEALFYFTTTAYSDDPDDLDTSMINLVAQVRAQWRPTTERPSMLWCDLLAPDSEAANANDARLVERLGQGLDVSVVQAPVTRFTVDAGAFKTAADAMAQALSWRSAANPLPVRIAAVADRIRKPAAALVAVLGLGLIAMAAFWSAQAWQMQGRSEQVRNESAQMIQRYHGLDVAPAELLERQAELIAFVGTLDVAERSLNPLGFLADLRGAANQRVRVLRVRLSAPGGAFQIDGVPLSGNGNERALSAFLEAMVAGGYQLQAEDPGNQSAQPGFFSYSVRRASVAAGATR